MKLEAYNAKRDFKNTSEPKGKIKKSSQKLRFVIQHHMARADHYDFRLEHEGVLLSWAVPKGLSANPKDKRLAVRVEDHPLDYVNFEGVIPKGNYGAGSVQIFDEGFYSPSFDFNYGLKKGNLKFTLFGKIFKGEFSLIKMDEKNWLIVKSVDEFARQIPKSAPKKFSVQLATLSNEIPSGKDWAFEIKYDGYRILAHKEKNKVCLFSRNNVDYSKKMPLIHSAISKIKANSFVIDGEVVAFDAEGRSDFSLLNERMKNGKEMKYVVFDLLALNGEDLRALPLKSRKEKLRSLINKSSKEILFSNHILAKGKECFNFAKEHNLEGIMAKKINSPYIGKRTDDWLKIKCYLRQEFVICGFSTSAKNPVLSALILGYFNGKNLIYAGKVGTGFDEKEKQLLTSTLSKIKQENENFSRKFKEKIIWVKPKLVAEIQFAELTRDKILRQPSFIGLREDKKAKDVHLEVK